jgi:hypothetical protein
VRVYGRVLELLTRPGSVCEAREGVSSALARGWDDVPRRAPTSEWAENAAALVGPQEGAASVGLLCTPTLVQVPQAATPPGPPEPEASCRFELKRSSALASISNRTPRLRAAAAPGAALSIPSCAPEMDETFSLFCHFTGGSVQVRQFGQKY